MLMLSSGLPTKNANVQVRLVTPAQLDPQAQLNTSLLLHVDLTSRPQLYKPSHWEVKVDQV